MEFHNYILLFIIAILIFFLIYSKRRTLIKSSILRKAVSIFTIFAIAVITIAIVIFPSFKSVKTTGKYSYSSATVELTDSSRKETFNSNTDFRKLSMLVYYPDSKEVTKNSCPLVVFSHGGISTSTSNLSLYKELASHGYVVVSISHTYHALKTKVGGKSIYIDSDYMRELQKEDSHKDIDNTFECFKKWMKLRTDDINFVIDSFIEKSEEYDSFYSLVDKNSIGVAGHSLGGAAALGVARQREDIKAVIALESPYMYDVIGVNDNDFVWNTNPYACPVMNIYSDSGYPFIEKDHKYVQNKNMYENDNVENYYIKGANHFTLTDLVRSSPVLCAILGGGYSKSGYDTLEFINQKSLAFFDKHLK